MNNTKAIVVKIGGSVIYNKNRVKHKLVYDLLRRIDYHHKGKKIIVFGCGNELHKYVYNNDLTDKPIDPDKNLPKRIGAFFSIYKKIDCLLENINNHFGKIYTPLHPAHLFIKNSVGGSSHEIIWFNKSLFSSVKNPITSGGVVLDRKLLFSAISSDTIAAYLATVSTASKLILVSDVDGVYSSAHDGYLLHTVSISEIMENKKYCISGGMYDKLRRISFAVLKEIPTYIVNGYVPERIEKIIQGKQTICTRIIP